MTVHVLQEQESEIEALRRRLAEAEETLRALRAGEVDSLVVETPAGPKIYALEEVGRPYRVLIESMNEGAATLTDAGMIAYCNRRFAEMLAEPIEKVMGTPLEERVAREDQWRFEVLLRGGWEGSARGEVSMRRADGLLFPVQLSVSVVEEKEPVLCIVATDLTEQMRMRELRDADQRKNEFLGMLSHELRNPLAPIRNSAYILRHAAPGSEQARRAQTVIERQAEHLTRLVDDLLDVTRIARGKIELRRERVELRELVWRAADDFRIAMDDRGIAFRTALPNGKVWADADATRLTQIIGNLLHNASKFTRKGDEVVLSLEADGQNAIIRVRDTGVGIAPELLPRIFDPFVQGERTLARTEGGLGLGLALVKGITELHGGSVAAESTGIGRGAEFTVRLPQVATPELSASPEPHPNRHNGVRRVLVVDDNHDAAESMADIVKMLGHAVEVAYDGASAIEKARASLPHVVLCDVGLPGMSGYDVARALRAAFIEGMQLFAVSGYAQPEDVKRAIEAGFDGHVAKPCNPEEIERLLS